VLLPLEICSSEASTVVDSLQASLRNALVPKVGILCLTRRHFNRSFSFLTCTSHLYLPCPARHAQMILTLEDGSMCTTVLTSSTTTGSISSSTPPKAVPTDIEANIVAEDVGEMQHTSEGTSDSTECKANNNQMCPHSNALPSRKLHKMFSSLSQSTTASNTTAEEENNKEILQVHQSVCPLCIRPFEHRDHVCESSSPRCSHLFHHDCIASWISLQNSCPCCAEPFVVLDTSDSK
jgi:Ring finger domain